MFPNCLVPDQLDGAAVAADDGVQRYLGLAAVLGAEDEGAAVELAAADHLIIEEEPGTLALRSGLADPGVAELEERILAPCPHHGIGHA